MSATAVTVQFGSLALPVQPGAADTQAPGWRAATWVSNLSKTLPPEHARHLVSNLRGAQPLHRKALYELVYQDLELAHTAVIVWGVGTTGNMQQIAPRLRRALAAGQSARLIASVRAAPHGIEALWDTHFSNSPPEGLGSTSYGSKWLHFAGWSGRLGDEPGPVIYDAVVWSGIRGCAALPDYAHPKGQQRSSWLAWCRLAHDGAKSVNGAASGADVELALFDHARNCPRAMAVREHQVELPLCSLAGHQPNVPAHLVDQRGRDGLRKAAEL